MNNVSNGKISWKVDRWKTEK